LKLLHTVKILISISIYVHR